MEMLTKEGYGFVRINNHDAEKIAEARQIEREAKIAAVFTDALDAMMQQNSRLTREKQRMMTANLRRYDAMVDRYKKRTVWARLKDAGMVALIALSQFAYAVRIALGIYDIPYDDEE